MNLYPMTAYQQKKMLVATVMLPKPMVTTIVLCSAASRVRFSRPCIANVMAARIKPNRKYFMVLLRLVVGLSHLISEG